MEVPTYYSPEEFKNKYQIDYMLFADQMKLPEFLHKCKENTGRYIFFDVYKSDLFRELDAYDKELLDSINKTKEEIELVLQELYDNKMQSIEPTKKSIVPDLEPYNGKERGSNVPYKIAMLDEMEVIKNLNRRYPNKTDVIKIIHYLVGGNLDNVRDYYNSIYGNYSGTKQVTAKHRDHAKGIYYK